MVLGRYGDRFHFVADVAGNDQVPKVSVSCLERFSRYVRFRGYVGQRIASEYRNCNLLGQ